MATETIRSIAEPWAPQQQYLKNLFSRANQLYQGGGPKYFPNSTVAPLSDRTRTANTALFARGREGSALNDATAGMLQDTISGGFLNQNPYLDDTYDRAASAVTRSFNDVQVPGMNAVFANSGRTGSGLHANAYDMQLDNLGRSLQGLSADIYGTDYANERQRMLQAAALAPEVAAQDYMDINAMQQAGALNDAQAQATLSDRVNRFNFNQMRPYDNLNRYASYIGGSYGQTGMQESPLYENQLGQGLGGALAGYGLGSSLFPGGFGGVSGGTLGAIGGGLLGLFG